MKARGKILREPGQAPGIVMIQGQQFQFVRESIWHSDEAPKPGLVVEVELDRNLQVVGISPVAEREVAGQQAEEEQLFSPAHQRRRAGFLSELLRLLTGGGRGSAPGL